MTPESWLTLGVLLMAILLFASERVRMDVVALLVVSALMALQVLTPQQALAGFGDPLVILSAGLFIVGEALVRTGIADSLGRLLARLSGASETRMILLAMLFVALLSAFMNSSGAAAVLMPVVISMGRRYRVSPSRLLLPLAYGALLGGLLTLIGTPPNLVVSEALAGAGFKPFGFLSFTPVGLLYLSVGLIFILLIGRHWLPDRSRHTEQGGLSLEEMLSLADLEQAYRLREQLFRLHLRPESPLIGQTLDQAQVRARYHVTVLEVQSRTTNGHLAPPRLPEATTQFQEGDVLLAYGQVEAIARLVQEQALDVLPFRADEDEGWGRTFGLVEVLLTPRSALIGRTLQERRFRDRYGVTVLGVMRMGQPLTGDVTQERLRFGDTLLIYGAWERISLLTSERRDFVVVGQPHEMLEVRYRPRYMVTTAIIMLIMLLAMTFEIIPPVQAVLLAVCALILSGCVTMSEAYTAMNWGSIVLLAGMLPLATALQKTGTLAYLAQQMVLGLGGYGPWVILLSVYLVTMLCSQFMANTAAAVLIAPLAIQTALSVGISPYPIMMAVAVGASTAFATPMASVTNTLVLGPGGYRFEDYLKLGGVLQLIYIPLTVLVIPLLFPF